MAGNVLQQDSDNDGVTDLWDECNDSQAGTNVNAEGCAVSTSNEIPDVVSSDSAFNTSESPAKAYLEQLAVSQNFTIAVQFEKNTANFSGSEYARLNELVKALQSNSQSAVIIEGHTSTDGNSDYNQKLGLLRANAVAKWLIQSAGLDSSRVVTVSYGDSMPKVAGSTEAAHEQNRRIEAKLVALNDLTARQAS